MSLLFVYAAPARAAEAERLSLDEALAAVERRSPEVLLARHAVTEANARRVGAGVVMPTNPRVQVEGRPPVTGGAFGDLGYAATLDLPFDIGGAPGARVREAEGHAHLANAELALAQVDAKAAVWAAYVRTQIADARIRATSASVEIARRIVVASTERANLGASGDIEQALAASDEAELEAALTGARREHELHMMELRGALDLPPTRSLVLTTPLTQPTPAPPVDALVVRALRERPELGVIARRIELLDATHERLDKERFPRVGIYGGVDAAPLSPVFGLVGISVELPFAQRNQGPLAIVGARRDAEMARLGLVRKRIERDVTRTRAAFDARRNEFEHLAERALPAAERTLGLVEMGWKSGRFDIFRVTTAARDVARIRSLRLDALEAAWVDRIALARATGELR